MADQTWGTLVEGSDPVRRYDKDEVKENLSLEWVLARAGIMLEPGSGDRLVGFCPFHDDGDSPAFAIWGDGLATAGCWSCGFGPGDVFDVLMRLHTCQFPQALQIGGKLLEELRADPTWVSRAGAAATKKPKADPHELTAIARECWGLAASDPTALERLIDEKLSGGAVAWKYLTATWLQEEWKLGAEDDFRTVIPHFVIEDDKTTKLVRGIKTRTPRSHPIAREGSDLQALYGAWRYPALGKKKKGRALVVTEGESDAWCASAQIEAVGAPYDVVALPSGASTPVRDQWLDYVKEYDFVVVALDGDLAGRRGSRRWWVALTKAKVKVLVASLPDGEDLAQQPDVLTVLAKAREVPRPVGLRVEADLGTWTMQVTPPDSSENGPRALANWAMAPERALKNLTTGATMYEGWVRQELVALSSTDLLSESAIKGWSTRTVDGNWLGSSKDAQLLLGTLQSEAPFLSTGFATSVVGWHDQHFVWPGGYVGPTHWRYVPPPSAVPMERLRIDPAGPWGPDAIDLMLQLHRRDVVDPILAWIFAAPLRSTWDTFPFLGVMGSSGSGKTTLVRAILDLLGWRIHTTLTGTTPHGVQSFVGATNGIPVWFDEYRPGARIDSLAALDQALRDSYDATPSFKGGGSEGNRLALTAMPTTAPIIVTGEDAFQETSHLERMIYVPLTRHGKNPEVLSALYSGLDGQTGLGHAYISWLVGNHRASLLPSLEVPKTADRQASNQRVLEIGWELLRTFHGQYSGRDIGEPHFDLHKASLAKASASDPTSDAITWALGTGAGQRWDNPCVLQDQDDVLVKVADFVTAVERAGVFVLPGREKAIANLLAEKWGAEGEWHPVHGRIMRLAGAAPQLMV